MSNKLKWTRNSFLPLAVLIVGAQLGAYTTDDQETTQSQEAVVVVDTTNIDPKADQLLREMGEYLVSLKEFSFKADVSKDVMLSHRQVIQLGGTAEVTLNRPGQARGFYKGDERKTQTYIDHGKFTVHNANLDVYAVTELPEGIDAALDYIFYELGYSVPLADLLYSDPYTVLIESVQSGFVVGDHSIDGTPCKHLAFSQESIDWEIWISSGDKPVPMMLVIRYKSEHGSPQYSAKLYDWDFDPDISANHFEFYPPKDVHKIEFLPMTEPEAETDTETETKTDSDSDKDSQ